MKYYLDTEFIESFHKPLFGKRRHFIDLISIGIVAEDGRTYSEISKEYNYEDADDWVKENVIAPLYRSQTTAEKTFSDIHNFHKYQGKSNKQIAREVFSFVNPYSKDVYKSPEFYGYFADYDWVLFCSLFGTMMDLPKGWPMYCRDLKQMLDGLTLSIWKIKKQTGSSISFEEQLDIIKTDPRYPKQTDEHNALADAKWNKRLHEFLLKM